MRRFRLVGWVLAGVVCISTVLPAGAGGWAVVTLDKIPDAIVSGQPIQVGFMVRQHGVTPMAGLSPSVRLWQSNRVGDVEVLAQPQDVVGHYQATLTFPVGGTWEWSIDAFGSAQRMPTLSVEISPGLFQPVRAVTATWPGVAFLVFIALGAVSGLVLLRRWPRLAMTMVSMSILAGAGAIYIPRDASPAFGQEGSDQAVNQGEALFIAKGCIVCHAQESVRPLRIEMGLESFSVGPDLTERTFSRSFLMSWLKDPQATKPGTMMPNLGLNGDEILALTEFINGGRGD